MVLYRGVSGEVAGVELSWLETETTISPRALGPVTSARLSQGIPLENVTAGYALLESYRSQIASADATAAASPAEGENTTATTTPE